MTSIFDLSFQHEDIDSKIAAALERLSQTFRVLLWEKTKVHNLSPIQIQILVYLLYHSQEAPTIGQIASRFSLTPATVSDAVKTLSNKSLVTRQAGLRDRRATSVVLTESGTEIAQKLAAWADIIRDQIARFAPGEKMVVMKFLMHLIETLQQAGLINIARMCITCKYFQALAHPDSETPHYCKLINKPLGEASLRLDCPEHEIKP